MKFYSEKLNDFFGTEDECLKAEKEYEENQKKKEKARKEVELKLTARKKELAKKVDTASEVLEAEYAKYDEAKKAALQIVEKAGKEADEIIKIAKENVSKAEKEKYSAIKAYNSEFGTYKKYYTREEAEKEYDKLIDLLKGDSFWSLFDKFWF